MDAPLDNSVLELLQQSPAGGMLDRPIGDVLADMGLPPLPDLSAVMPLPDMPALPVLDLAAMAQPLTDLAGSLGTGTLAPVQPAAGQESAADGSGEPVQAADPLQGMDPAQLLSQVSSTLSTAMQMGSTMLSALMSLWQGMGSEAAAAKSAQTAANTAEVAGQSTQIATGVVAGAETVFRGKVEMAAVVGKYATSMAMAAPFMVTPPGQAFAVAATVESITEALAVIGHTRAELTMESAQMTATAQKVPVTNAASGVDSSQILSQLASILPALAGAASSGVQQAAKAHKTITGYAERERLASAESGSGIGPGGGGMAGGIGGAGMGGAAMGGAAAGGSAPAARPLSPWSGTHSAGGHGPAAAGSSGSSATPGAAAPAGRVGRMMPGGLMPMGGAAAGMARAGEAASSAADGFRAELVTEQHGNEVIGDIDAAALPVVGAADPVAEPHDEDPPDKALTL